MHYLHALAFDDGDICPPIATCMPNGRTFRLHKQHYIIILFLPLADSRRARFISSLSLVEGSCYKVDRANIYSSVMTFFATNRTFILQEYPLIIRFKGERAVDVGGVSRDMFSAFYESVCSQYCDGVSLLYPVVNPHV